MLRSISKQYPYRKLYATLEAELTCNHSLRQLLEADERARLSATAVFASQSRGRELPEEPDPIRTCFMRDRDRILHSKAFRRLKHKTQVFVTPGDHYRTRLTHSLEVSQIARTVSRALRLNEDLTEAIALGHDVGHTPFGHAGEQALDSVLADSDLTGLPKTFRHYEQSVRVLTVLEPLNLTIEVLEGIGGHSKGQADLKEQESGTSLEATVVRFSDRIAYVNHDLDDALRYGFIDRVPDRFMEIGTTHAKRIGAMVLDLVNSSLDGRISFSKPMLEQLNDLKEWLFEHVYLRYPQVVPDIPKAKAMVRSLFLHYLGPGELPDGFEGAQGALDYVSGMTDRFAVRDFERLFIPGSGL